MFAGVADWLAGQGHHSSLLVIWEEFVAGDDESVHVADTTPRGEDAVPFTPADDVPHLQEDLVLHHDEDRSDLVSEHVGIGRGCQPLPSHAQDVQALGQLVEEVRVARPYLIPGGQG